MMFLGTKKSRENYSDILSWDKKVPNTEIEKFKKIIEDKYKLPLHTYWDLHRWTVDNFPSFWEEVWNYFGIVFSKPHEKVFEKTGPGYLDNKWFIGAQFNYAENVLKIRDNREALLCLDEEGHFDTVTFSEMFEEVKLYAAAFRKQGLRKGDRVACYMSNRKEAIFAMLAANSVGAIWGGPQPYLGARAAASIMQRLEAKFLIVVDRIEDEYTREDDNLVDNLPLIVESAPSLECIIIVPTKDETLQRDISHIPNSCLLGDFLACGRTPDGGVPDLVFEQLPFDHPITIFFSSGTTGPPKEPVHPAGSLLCPMVEFGLHFNLKSGDTIFSVEPMGWIVWMEFVTTLSMGVRLFLFNGRLYSTTGGRNVWDLLSEHEVSLAVLVPSILEKMEKLDIKPKQNANFENLQFFIVTGSPMSIQHHKYLKSIFKEDVCIVNQYGATETFGGHTGCDLNSPSYAVEIQVPGLGIDLQVFDEDGRSVIGEIGELVITNSYPAFPIGLWKDLNNEILTQTYLSKYPGIWQQHDEGCINPRTKGLVVLGRSDNTFIQNGDKFGSADIYFAIQGMEGIEDYICVSQKDSRVVLFLQMKEGHSLTPEFREKVEKKIESELWEGCVPEVILQVKGIPYNLNNKKVESLIRKIVATNQIPEDVTIKNPQCLIEYCNISEIMNYNKD